MMSYSSLRFCKKTKDRVDTKKIWIVLFFCYFKLYGQDYSLTPTNLGFNTEYACLYNNRDTIFINGYSLINWRSSFAHFNSIYIPSTRKLINRLSINDSTRDYASRNINLIKSQDRFISCYRSASKDSFFKSIAIFNSEGKLLKVIENSADTKGGVYFNYIYENIDSSFIVYAVIDYEKLSHPYYRQLVFRLDKNFRTIDSLYADSFNFNQQYQFKVGGLVSTTIDNYRLVMNPYKFSCNFNQSKYDIEIVDFDKNLKVKKRKSLTNRKLTLNNSLYVDNNNSILYGQSYDTNVCLPSFQIGLGRPYLAMLDSNLNFKWEIEFEKGKSPSIAFLVNYSLDRAIPLKDGNFLAVGNYDYPSSKNPNGLYGSSGLLIKFDKKGQILWSIKHRFDDSLYCPESNFFIRDVAELSNGEIVAVGAVNLACASNDTNVSPQRGWILHLDKQGRTISSQILNSELNTNIKIYPNPSNSFINIAGLINHRYELVLYNAFGKRVLSRFINTSFDNFQFNIDELPVGTYFLYLSDLESGNLFIEKISKI